MTTLPRLAPSRGHIPYWLIAASFLAAFVAVLPIVAAIWGEAPGGTSTAFAVAPAGSYAITARSEDTEDIVVATRADGSIAPIEVARISHLRGFAAKGAVSPDGQKLAVVAADSGTVTRPIASLLVVDLVSGAIARVAERVDEGQNPVWSADGATIAFTRTTAPDGPGPANVFTVSAAGGSEAPTLSLRRVLGLYPVAFDTSGQLISVVIDGRGSTVLRGAQEIAPLSAEITRDWRLSIDGESLAFIEADTTGGLYYRARTVSLRSATAGQAVAQSLAVDGQQLGVAWKPGALAPTFGAEPAATAGLATAQSLASGFDVPLAYSADGAELAVQAWSGSSFADPGSMQIELVDGNGARLPLAGATRFFGWAAR
ncbi:MAG: PD40 domain-containing protein [Chloroflexi bacterium]|nr:PD40 domain-containing protein [Chloroflexota bacterium]